MRDLHDVFGDLAAAEDPVEWACDNLRMIDRGSAAYVFEHPDDARFVIRISDYPDGWFGYAEDTINLEEAGDSSHHRPSVAAITVVSGVFAGIGERLEPIEDGTWLADAVDAVIRALTTRNGWNKVASLVPGFPGFVAGLESRLDIRPENFMRRGDTLVYNDPYSALPYERERRMRDRYAFGGSDSAVRPPVPPCRP
jgi:hypothetical protein|nr:hypothetical protein [Neorhizobium tomejilense]